MAGVARQEHLHERKWMQSVTPTELRRTFTSASVTSKGAGGGGGVCSKGMMIVPGYWSCRGGG